ncbi:uncharacterized protein IUM83_03447 [Phytophthora cinnamomi]|uniref:uncharacterized protein n=1 Tax=Phytophthora cinnamomi TaxID=4785 RepID=UPI00355A1E33|nr:hypothetical protein IUM83_03447 [Phytophthora cinnamomi]
MLQSVVFEDPCALAESSRKTTGSRKQTAYETRKQRKRALVEQVDRMQRAVDQLKLQLLVRRGFAGQAVRRSQAENKVLLELIQEQHVALAKTQAALAAHAQRSLPLLQPAQSVIRLGTDQEGRFNTLMALKERELDTAERYLDARSRGLDPRSGYCQEERFDSARGDYCVVRFETVPVYGANTREVFDAILRSVLNAEMFLSEMFGCVAVREDSDFETAEVAQIRLVTLTSAGTTVESNTVMFSRAYS